MDPLQEPLPPAPLPPPPTTPDETAHLLAAWQISPETHAHILHTRILPTELHPFLPAAAPSSPPSPQNNSKNGRGRRPLAVLILGQTGAGKTRFTPLLLSALRQQTSPENPSPGNPSPEKPLHLIADTYKTHHPHFAACLATHPRLASRLASADAARWLHAVCAHAARARVPAVVVEAAARRAGDFRGLAGVFAGEGYAVRVVVLAVPAALSRLGIAARYFLARAAGGEDEGRGMPVRFTPRGVHDESFEGVGGVVGWLDGDEPDEDGERGGGQLVERIVMLRRGGGVVYSNERRGKGWARDAGALRALERERTRALTPEERRAAEEDIRRLKALRNPKVDKEVEEIERLMAGLGAGDGTVPEMVSFDPLDFVKRVNQV